MPDQHRKTQLQVGRPWPKEELEVVEIKISSISSETKAKTRLLLGMASLLGLLLIVYTAYGIANTDQSILDRVLRLVEVGFYVLASWAAGTSVLTLISRLKLQEEDAKEQD